MANYTISADAGGTFLDLVLVDDTGRIAVGKSLHTPNNPEVGIMEAVGIAAKALDLDAQSVLDNCTLVFHGTTVTTNGMIERTGVRTGLICTKGFEDTLRIGRVKARTEGLDQYQLTQYTLNDPPPPIVSELDIAGVSGRMDAQGTEILALDMDALEAGATRLVQAGVEAIVISFLHSYANPAHEQQACRFLRDKFPTLHIMASTDVASVLGEYERTNTAVVNANLNPLLQKHLSNLGHALESNGYHGPVLIMQSIGGVSPMENVRHQSVTTLLSGPVGGIVGAQQIGGLIGESNIITTDMGGTSFDVGLVVGGQPIRSAQTVIHRHILTVPAVDIETIGAGGGSAVWLDDNGNIKVGPRSVGSNPGPACYGLGGLDPTVTDADVVLGFIDTSSFAFAHGRASRDYAVAAIEERIGRPLGLSAEEAAHGVLQIVNNQMADLIRKVTIEKGHDPGDFVLLAYGGSGPAHCTAYGAEIGAKKIVIPPYASVFSAYGIAQADVQFSVTGSVLQVIAQDTEIPDETVQTVNDILTRIADQAQDQIGDDFSISGADPQLRLSIDIHYIGQMTDIAVPVDAPLPLDRAAIKDLMATFRKLYDMNYGSGASSPASPIELVNARADVLIPLPSKYQPVELPVADRDPSAARSGSRSVYWGGEIGWRETDIYKADLMQPGNQISGPALIELFRTTVPIYRNQLADKDVFGNLVVTAASKDR
ncbi:MAG TPA: hypothetical protein DCL95_07345 [Rhodospirillaceae bacterium]|jgi:N-methylhydantoinase A|uniref:hydantoinase/oxoprolinase family protein n=11 Tax=Alphaproteobacteria TaxID=28211 RepID=UPI000C0BA8D2|nr:hydantoinase/oxoprolinase family protein [Hyphomonas sp. UBA3201]MAC52610.1 hypothetical protein [Gimesia sp.]MAL76333.1 hypothetical protein [Rhodospirillaceae bacterium]MAO93787.1 hypothetical protein [Rhodospirillales bacterium]MAX64860.1 hypothetical protein [Rhodospirillaceae bacterium]MAX65144.1 hypothetical protein [Rhodospirillaceae bacterium]|tara:strand:+ start:5299 stop:7434 length:2136 start_codon:yes stop_codon:yes gene_type:complete